MVPFSEIEANEYNLNIPRYIDSSEPEDRHDLTAHLNGGVPDVDIEALADYWHVFPNLRSDLFAASGRDGYSRPLVAANEIKATILNHPDFISFAERIIAIYRKWQTRHDARLRGLQIGDDPKRLITDLSEDLLATVETQHLASDDLETQDVASLRLIDKYRIYQLLMDYWAETMQDDVYLITQDGWAAGNLLRELLVTKGEKAKETPDLTINRKKYKADLIPPALLVARYFGDEQAEIERLTTEKEAIAQELAALLEEHGGEEGALADAVNEKGKVTKAALTARRKQLLADPSEEGELAILEQCLQLMTDEAAMNKALKAAQTTLDNALFARYPQLSAAEMQTLVVADKWQAALAAAIATEIERVTQQLAARVKLLAERYAQPLPQLVDEVAALSAKVDAHLRKMGVSW